MNDTAGLREEAIRARRLAAFCTDKKIQADLNAYAQELNDRADRMDAASERSAKTPGPKIASD